MSAIVFYKCSEDCGLRVPLWVNSPVFREDTPKEKRGIPVSLAKNEEYVIGYTSQRACLSCKNIVSIVNTEHIARMKRDRAYKQRNIFQKIKGRFIRPKPLTIPKVTVFCPKCGADQFLTLGAKCHLCGKGEVVAEEDYIIF